MKIEINIEKIKYGINLVEKVTGKNLTLPVLSSILLIASGKTLKLRATNLSVGVEVEIPVVKIENEGTVAIPGSILSGVFSNIIQNENIIIENEDGNITVKTKKSKIKLK